MGDFQGHPFRGNQWTDGSTVGVSPEDRGLVLSSGVYARGGLTRRGTSIAETFGRNMKNERTREEWSQALKVEQATAKVATVEMKSAIAAKEAFTKRMSDDLHKDEATALNAREAAREALRKAMGMGTANAYSDPEYLRLQRETIETGDALFRAQSQWLMDHGAESSAIDARIVLARDARRDALLKAAKAEGAIGAYDKDATRAVQVTAEARDPRETPATAVSAVDGETMAAIDAANADKSIGSRYSHIVAQHDRNGAFGQLIYKTKSGRQVLYKPAFAATVKDGADFKKKMSDLFPGASIEGLPRNADTHILTMVHDEFRTLRDEYPEVAVRAVKLNAGGLRATAWSNDDKITFGKEGIANFGLAHNAFGAGKSRETPDEWPDFHDGTRSYASVVRHEFGHQVHFQHPELYQAFNAEMAKIDPRVRARVTGYANKNHMERFAETFAMVKYGDKGTKAHPVVQAMDRVVKDYFKRVRSTRSKEDASDALFRQTHVKL